jgi:putative SOS response-associated peptidase YedK
MCGRFTLHHSEADIAARFAVQETLPLVTESFHRYNIAPTQPVAAVTYPRTERGQERFLEPLHWGLIPAWAKETAIGSRLINARAETLLEKPSFKSAFRWRRCLVISDGFYEWDKVGGTRQPYYFRRKDGNVFAFAGLWEEWRDQNGGEETSPIRSCTIITTTPNDLVAAYHDRMPVMLPPDVEDAWLTTPAENARDLLPLLCPYPDDWMEAIPVSKAVNSPTNDNGSLLLPIDR